MKHRNSSELQPGWRTMEHPWGMADLATACNPPQPDDVWERALLNTVGRVMKEHGINQMEVIVKDDGKLEYTLNAEVPERLEDLL